MGRPATICEFQVCQCNRDPENDAVSYRHIPHGYLAVFKNQEVWGPHEFIRLDSVRHAMEDLYYATAVHAIPTGEFERIQSMIEHIIKQMSIAA